MKLYPSIIDKTSMTKIPDNIYPGAKLLLAYFGNATIQKILVHSAEKQIVCNVITQNGDTLFLRPDYASKCVVV